MSGLGSPPKSRSRKSTTVLLTTLGGFYWLMRKRLQATRNETVQAVFIGLLAAYGVLTVTGVWFRGAGMALSVPW